MNHVLITGNPSLTQMEEFITEFFHEDHLGGDLSGGGMSSSRSVTGENTELVFLLPLQQSADDLDNFLELRENFAYRRRVSLYHGDVYDSLLINHAYDAVMIFVLPNLYSKDLEKEDRHNVMRVMHLKSVLQGDLRVTLLLHLSELRHLVRSFGIPDTDVVCANEFKGSVMAKASVLPGFNTLVCNLFKAVGGSYAGKMETMQSGPFLPWEKAYLAGLEKEIYEVPFLSQ